MSGNQAKKLFDSMTNIGDDLIEEAQSAARKKPPAWMRWSAAAACLCLIAAAIFAAAGGKTPAGQVVISAEDLAWATGLGSDGTSNYALRRFDGSGGIPLSPVQDSTDAEELSVYRSLHAQNSNQTYELLLSWVEDIAKQAQENLGMELACGEVVNGLMNNAAYDSNAPLSDQYMYWLKTDLCYADAVLTLSCVSEGQVTMYDLDGILPLYETAVQGLLPSLTDPSGEELAAAAEPLVTFVNQLTGKNYTLEPSSVYWRADGTVAGLHFRQTVRAGSALSAQMFDPSGSLHIQLKKDGSGVFRLDSASILEHHYLSVGEYALIGLSEAEAYLQKGYHFGGVQCPVCKAAASPQAVDFSQYDLVQVEYYSNLMEFALPYYAFYKHLETGEYPDGEGTYEDYAVVYVPAIRVEGLEEYFRDLEAQHKGTGHSLLP